MNIACTNTNLAESKRRKHQGETPTEVRAQFTRIYESTHDGESFVSALIANNYSLVRSTRKVIFVIDPKGGEHNLIKRIDAPRKEIESKLAGIQIASLKQKKCRNREAIIKCFLTPAEKAEIETKANQAELSVSGFLRSLFFGTKTRQPKASRRPALEKAELVSIRFELRKIAENLTQIANTQNQSGCFDAVAYTEVCDQHKSVLDAILNALSKKGAIL